MTDGKARLLNVFVLEIAVLLLVPLLVFGLGLAAVSGTEHFLPGLGLGAIVGVGAAALIRIAVTIYRRNRRPGRGCAGNDLQ
ncbi:hypothetical protein [Salinadaptatus halalkaliphilus]|nr:hypothetical protein [Salinadaptatus halalkaliphilus]